MGETFKCGVVGYARNITYIRLEPNKDKGPFWHQMLPWIKGNHFVWDLTHKDVKANLIIQELPLMSSMLQKRNVKVWVRGVTPDLARLLSKQKTSLPNVSCLDVEAPYYCSLCSSLHALTLNLCPTKYRELSSGKGYPEAPPCPVCKTSMRFNDIPQQFFSFLNLTHAPNNNFLDPSLVNRAFNDAELSRAGSSSHLDKKLWWSGNNQEHRGDVDANDKLITVSIETGIAMALIVTTLALLGAMLARLI